MKKIKRTTKQKAARGLQDVVVPQAGNMGQVANSAVSMASTGMALGGPVGAGIGAVAGGVMGLLQKKEMDEANELAEATNLSRKNSRAYGADDTSITQAYQQYALGGEPHTKPIEVEKDELIFRKVGGKFKLKADFKGGKPHAKGGEDYQAKEGDIIFPGKQRSKVLGHLKSGNHSALEGMRLKLPKDVPQGEAKAGVDLLPTGRNTNSFTGLLPTSLQSFLPMGESQVGLTPEQQANGFSADGAMATPMGNYNYGQDITSFVSATGAWNSAETPTKAMPDGSNLLQYASVANNLIQGLSPAEKVQENYYQPELLTYEDRSQGARNQTMQTRNSQFAGARNSSGGNVQVQRAIQSASDSNRQKTLGQIDTQEQGRADQVRATNVQLKNQANQINSQKADQYGDMQSRNNAAKQSYMDAATGQLASLGNVKEQQKYQKSLDAKKDQYDNDYLGYLNNTTQFQIDEDSKNATFNPAAPRRLPRYPTTVSKTEDAKGKIKTKTTQKK